jgi:hypothetical protein
LEKAQPFTPRPANTVQAKKEEKLKRQKSKVIFSMLDVTKNLFVKILWFNEGSMLVKCKWRENGSGTLWKLLEKMKTVGG